MTRLTLRIDFDDTRQIGHGKIRLLELIDREGSISAAARAIDMSYRRAWLLVDEVNRTFSEPVIETQLGGRGGGRAKLTTFGRALVQVYRSVEKDASVAFAARLSELERHLAPASPGGSDSAAPLQSTTPPS
jgi:molybdate transport system regulatory protein